MEGLLEPTVLSLFFGVQYSFDFVGAMLPPFAGRSLSHLFFFFAFLLPSHFLWLRSLYLLLMSPSVSGVDVILLRLGRFLPLAH